MSADRVLTAPGIAADAANAAFETDVAALLETAEERQTDELLFGIETEYPVIDEDFRPLDGVRRDRLVDSLQFTGKEFGAATVEARTDPHDSLATLAAELGTREAVLADTAAEYGATPLRYGTHPFMAVEDFERSHGERYEVFSDLLADNANPAVHDTFGASGTDPRSVGVSGMICSTQLNIQAHDADDAVSMANGLYAANPYLIAVTGNARLFEANDTGYADIRMPLWERSCDTRTADDVAAGNPPKPGKLDAYYEDLADYLKGLDRFFFADPAEIPALGQALGHQWKDVRIKPTEDAFLVENRPISTQPSAVEDIAAHAYTLGQALYRREHPEEPLPDIEQMNRNRYTAMFNGLDEPLYNRNGVQRPAKDVVAEELGRAAAGLEAAGQDPAYLAPLYDRLDTGVIPSEASATAYHEARAETGPYEALEKVLPAAGGTPG